MRPLRLFSRVSLRLSARAPLAALCLVALLWPPAPFRAPSARAAGNTFHVAASGDDDNDGSPARPFRQIRRALAAAGPGDTVLVADGDYLGFDLTNVNGTAAAPLVVRATGANANVLPTTDRADNRDTIHVSFSTHVVVEGLRSANANRAAMRVNQSHHVTVRGCVFGNNARWGLFTNHSDDLLIENNECFGSGLEHGIYVSNSGDRPVVRGNRLHDNRGAGVQLNADLSAGGDGIISGALIERNVVYNNGAGGGGAINLDGVHDSVVRNNLLYNNHSTGITNFRQDGAEGPRGMQILHNTIDMPADGRWALLFNSTTGRSVVRNNVLYNRHPFRGGLLFTSAADAANTDSDYNVLDRVSTDDGSTRLTLAQWRAQGRDPHSLSATPVALFADDAARDYRLKAGSPAVNAGETLAGVAADIEGRARPLSSSSDIGCYEFAAAGANPIDDPEFFVRQHYLDFLGREPDAGGQQFWTNEITSCGADAACVEVKRINVSAAFFLSIEFQETGYLVHRTYKAAYGDINPPAVPVPVRREEFLPDTAAVSAGVQVGVGDWRQRLEQNKQQFAEAFAARARFASAHPPSLTAEQFVAALDGNAGGVLDAAERTQLVSDLSTGAKTRGQVLRAVAEDADLARQEFNRAFVLMQYFGYLRRNPNDPPDANFDGYHFWLGKLEEFGGNFVQAEMVKAFLLSNEYRRRFGQ
jgi:parallel beta-helix repeat protein